MHHTSPDGTVARGYRDSKDDLLQRLRRIEGQVRGIQRMLEQDRGCTEVLQQAAAVTAAMDRVAMGLLRDHVTHCIAEETDDPARRATSTAEMLVAIERLVCR